MLAPSARTPTLDDAAGRIVNLSDVRVGRDGG
jgi:hypothetical protein